MNNLPLIIVSLTAAALTLSSCAAGTQPAGTGARVSGSAELAAGPPNGATPTGEDLAQPQADGLPAVSACAAVLAEARAAGDDLTGGTELYERHLQVCHTNPPAPQTDLATTTTAALSDLV